MARTAIGGGYNPNAPSWQIGPFEDSNGNLYLLDAQASISTFDVWKSAAGGTSWSAQDTANRPGITGANFRGAAGYVSGTVLHIVTVAATTPAHGDLDVYVEYHTYNLSDAASNPDTWQITDEAVVASPSFTSPTYTALSRPGIFVRSDGDVIVLYRGADNTSMGTDYWTVKYARRESGSWTGNIAVSDTALVQYQTAGLFPSATSDACQFVWTSSSDTYGRSLNSSNTLGSQQTLSSTTPYLHFGTSYIDGSTFRALVGNIGANVAVLKLVESSGNLAADGSGFNINDAAANTAVIPGAGVDTVGDAYYAFWARSSDSDLVYDTFSTTATAGGTDSVHRVGSVVSNYVYVEYLPDANEIGVVYYEASAWYYDPLALTSTQTVTLNYLNAAATIYAPTLHMNLTLNYLDASATIYQPTVKIVQTVTLPLFDASATIYQPTLHMNLTLAYLDASPTIYDPTVNLNVALDYLNAAASLFAPQVGHGLTLDYLDASPSLFAPTVTPGAVTVTLDFVSGFTTIYAPQVNHGLTLPFVDASATLFAPTVHMALTLDYLDASPTLFAPQINMNVALGYLDATATIYQPTVTLVQTVTLPYLDAAPSLFAPTLHLNVTLAYLDASPTLYAVGVATNIVLPHLDAAPSLFAPTVTTTTPITLNYLDASASLFAPQLDLNVVLGYLDAAATVYDPTVALAANDQTVTLDHLDASATIYAPTLHLNVGLPYHQIPAVLYAPTITTGAVTVTLNYLNAEATLYAPTVLLSQQVTLGYFDAAATIYQPQLNLNVTLDYLEAGVIYEPTVTLQLQVVTLSFVDAAPFMYGPIVHDGTARTLTHKDWSRFVRVTDTDGDKWFQLVPHDRRWAGQGVADQEWASSKFGHEPDTDRRTTIMDTLGPGYFDALIDAPLATAVAELDNALQALGYRGPGGQDLA